MLLKLKPQFKKKMWGGTKIAHHFNFNLKSDSIGECWGISGLEDNESLITNGPYKNKTLTMLWKENSELFGHHPSQEFPILVKLIDANDDLSIQVHPDDVYAKQFDSFGKTECWYILDTEKDSEIIIGHKANTFEEFKAYVDKNKFKDLVNFHPVKKGDKFYIDPGTIHGIGKGTLLLEIQQSSDITYRFYDYDRLYNGEKRDLHIKEALDVVKIPDKDVVHFLDTDYFKVEKLRESGTHKAHTYGDYLIVTEGKLTLNSETLSKGDFFILTSRSDYTLNSDKPFECIRVRLT